MTERPHTRAPRTQAPLTWEDVLSRNPAERIKQEKNPFDLIDELPQLVEVGYEAVSEDDIFRLRWWGLYHDKPKTGEFMMRIKLAGGVVTPEQLDAIGRISREFGKNTGEITTRQDIQLHRIELPALPEVFNRLRDAGLTTSGACGDILRNITSCPVAGIDPEELFDVGPVLQELVDFFYGNREYSNLPRKHKWSVAACPYHCNAPHIHDVSLVGTEQDGEVGFAVLVGGGLSTAPRLGRSLGVFIRPGEAREVLQRILDVWSGDLRYRRARGKARFKFMVDDYGPEEILRRVEERLGRKLTPLKELPVAKGRTDHMGVRPEKVAGLYYIGFPVFAGLLRGDQMSAVAEVAAEYGRDVRFTREQNLIVTGVPEAAVDRVIGAMEQIGISLRVNPIRGRSIACTGNPYCNYAVGDTKPRLVQLVEHLERRFGEAAGEIRIHLDGCPHACGQHFVGDIGIQGTTRRDEDGKIMAYDIYLRGGLGKEVALGTPLARRVPTGELDAYVERLVGWYLKERADGESLQAFCNRHSDEEILAVMEGSAWQERLSG